MEETIKIIIRSRLLNPREISNNESNCLSNSSSTELFLHLNQNQAYKFPCDLYCSGKINQAEFFQSCGIINLLNSILNGYRSCIFAYGQTGAGKTHTMIGPSNSLDLENESCGLIGRSLKYLYEQLNDLSVEYIVRISCVELYQEHLYDLLVVDERDRASLSLREHPKTGFFIEGCTIIPCPTINSARKVIEKALKCRQIGAHDMNHRSNRSHFITDISIELPGQSTLNINKLGHGRNTFMRELTNDMEENREYTIMGKISFVDLAGSERLKNTNSTGKVLLETGSINSSLYVLGKVIASLSKNITSDKKREIPYRDSKLTKLLITSLGGTSRTMMITCISESSAVVQETLRTLRFTMSAARIKNHPVRFLDPQEKLILELKEEIKRLRIENQQLRQVNVPSFGFSSFSSVPSSGSGEEGKGLVGHENGENSYESEEDQEREEEEQENIEPLDKEILSSHHSSPSKLETKSLDKQQQMESSLKRIQSDPFNNSSTNRQRKEEEDQEEAEEGNKERNTLRNSTDTRISISASAIDAGNYVPILQQRRLQQQQQKKGLKKKKKKKMFETETRTEEEYQQPFLPPVQVKLKKEIQPSPRAKKNQHKKGELQQTDKKDSSPDNQVVFPPIELQITGIEGRKKLPKKKLSDGSNEVVIKIKSKPVTKLSNPYTAHLQPKKPIVVNKSWDSNFASPAVIPVTKSTSQNQKTSLSPRRRSERERIPIPIPDIASPRKSKSVASAVVGDPSKNKSSTRSNNSNSKSAQSSSSSSSSSFPSQRISPESVPHPSLDTTLHKIRKELQSLESQLESKKEDIAVNPRTYSAQEWNELESLEQQIQDMRLELVFNEELGSQNLSTNSKTNHQKDDEKIIKFIFDDTEEVNEKTGGSLSYTSTSAGTSTQSIPSEGIASLNNTTTLLHGEYILDNLNHDNMEGGDHSLSNTSSSKPKSREVSRGRIKSAAPRYDSDFESEENNYSNDDFD